MAKKKNKNALPLILVLLGLVIVALAVFAAQNKQTTGSSASTREGNFFNRVLCRVVKNKKYCLPLPTPDCVTPSGGQMNAQVCLTPTPKMICVSPNGPCFYPSPTPIPETVITGITICVLAPGGVCATPTPTPRFVKNPPAPTSTCQWACTASFPPNCGCFPGGKSGGPIPGKHINQ